MADIARWPISPDIVPPPTMAGETMVGHDQHDDIPPGEQFPLWQSMRKNKAWAPQINLVYFSPDGRIGEKTGIFCTAVNGFCTKKEKTWKTHTDMKQAREASQKRADAEPARRAEAALRAANRKAKDALLNAEQKRTGLIPIKSKPKATAKSDWETDMDKACEPERDPKRRRSDELELGHKLTYESDDPGPNDVDDYDPNAEAEFGVYQ